MTPPAYWKTLICGVSETHIGGIAERTLCGLAEDADIYDRAPECLPSGKKHDINCVQCLQLLDIAQRHFCAADAAKATKDAKLLKAGKPKKQASKPSLPTVDGFKPVTAWSRVNSAKLHSENRVYIHPVCAVEDSTFKVLNGWRLAGWGSAPWASPLGSDAIVYEKLTPANFESPYASSHASFEPGIYWGHGNAWTMLFPVDSH